MHSKPAALIATNRLLELIVDDVSGPDWWDEAQNAHREAVAELKSEIAMIEGELALLRPGTDPRSRKAGLDSCRKQLEAIEDWGMRQFAREATRQ